jgi:hypothetical protein
MYQHEYITIPANALCFSQAVSYSSVSAVSAFSTYRIKKLEMWYTPPGVLGLGTASNLPTLGAFTISVTPIQTVSGKQVIMKEYSDSVLSVSDTAHVVWRPDKMTLAGNWNSVTDTSGLFAMQVLPGTIIDITIEAVFADGGGDLEVRYADTVTLTFPLVGGFALDLDAGAGVRVLQPVGIQTAFI